MTCLSFANLSKDCGANIRVIKVAELQSMAEDAAQHNGSLFPLLGGMPYSDNTDELPQMLQVIVDLPEGATDKELGDAAIPVFTLFNNGPRYAINPDFPENIEVIEDDSLDSSTLFDYGIFFDYSKTYWEQVTTCDGNLRGIIEVGSEGVDVWGRDYWDCILVTPGADRLVFLTFNLRGGYTLQYDRTSAFWPAAMADADYETIIKKQHEMLTELAKSVVLLD
jgi:hypothetical protein